VSSRVKEEMRKNLVRKIKAGEELFPGIIGFEDPSFPRWKTRSSPARTSSCLGERGQAKSRLIRSLRALLDKQSR